MDSLAVSYAGEVSRWGSETSIVVPGAFTTGTNNFANAGKPEDGKRVAAYEAGPYRGFAEFTTKAFAATVPQDAALSEVARAITRVGAMLLVNGCSWCMSTPHRMPVRCGRRGGRIRTEFLRRIVLGDLLTPVTHLQN